LVLRRASSGSGAKSWATSCSLRAVTVRLAGEDYRLRTPLEGATG
jgi:hypothetical protein